MAEPARRINTRMGKAYEVDGRELPSVTTVLKQLAAPALTDWRMKQVAKAAVELQDWRIMPPGAAEEMLMAAGNAFGEMAAAQGTEIHDLLEAGQAARDMAPAAYLPYMAAATRALEIIGEPAIYGAEVTLANLYKGYAGTADLIYRLPNDAGLGVLDWKSKANPESTAGWSNDLMQLAALAACDVHVTREGELLPMPDEIVELSIVAIKSDGTTDVRMMSSAGKITAAQDAFFGLVKVHEMLANAGPYFLGHWDESYEGESL